MSPGGETEHYLMSSVLYILYTSHYTILRPPVLEEFNLKLIHATPRFTFTLSILWLVDVRSFNSLFHRLNNIVRLLDCPKAHFLLMFLTLYLVSLIVKALESTQCLNDD